jgi:hypothetical protein
MAEGARLLQVGTVAGVAVMADTRVLGHDVEVKVVIGGTDFIATRPPGWPSRPHNTGTAAPLEGSTTTFRAGSTVRLLRCEAVALVTAGYASNA